MFEIALTPFHVIAGNVSGSGDPETVISNSPRFSAAWELHVQKQGHSFSSLALLSVNVFI